MKRGIAFGDMGRKTIGNDLDNAWVKFDGVSMRKRVFVESVRGRAREQRRIREKRRSFTRRRNQ